MKRIENPDVDDLGQGAVELTHDEYEQFLLMLRKRGLPTASATRVRRYGFVSLRRTPGMDNLFQQYGMQEDVQVIAICREGRLDAMRTFIATDAGKSEWPEV
jgi:hypothetical protein